MGMGRQVKQEVRKEELAGTQHNAQPMVYMNGGGVYFNDAISAPVAFT